MATLQMIKLGFSLLLVVAFFILFGYQSILRLLGDDTLIVEELVDFKFSSPPLIAIKGWRKFKSKGILVEPAKATRTIEALQDVSSIQSSFEEYIIGYDKIVDNAYDAKQENISSDLWQTNMGVFYSGFAYSINNSYAIGSENPIVFELGSEYSITLMVLDPNFFIFSTNQMTFPRIQLDVREIDEGIFNINIEAIYHYNMDKQSNPCNQDKDYSFTSCVRSATSRKAGCRYHLDTWTDPSIPVCKTGQQVLNLSDVFQKLASMDKTSIIKETHCLPPCSFTEYKLGGEVEKEQVKGVKKLKLKLTDSKVKRLTEKKLYDFVTFIAEFGGALGLFVGFSFLSLFDYYEFALKFLPGSK